MIEFGFVCAGLLELVVISPHRHDFLEMFIHHSATLMLLFFSSVMGFTRIGVLTCVVLFLVGCLPFFTGVCLISFAVNKYERS